MKMKDLIESKDLPMPRPTSSGRSGLPARIVAVVAASVASALALPRLAGLLAPPHAAPSATTRFRDRPEGRIAYDDVGSGPLVVLVPGMGDLRAEYRFLAPKLVEAGYRVVALDIRGHGESDTSFSDYSTSAVGSDVVALIRALGAGPALVVGTSMGAGAAAWAAAEAPDLVQGIVLIGPFVRETELPGPIPAPLIRLFLQAFLSRPWGPSAWASYYANSFYPTFKPVDLAEYQAKLRSNLAEKGRIESLQRMMSYSKADVEARLGEVKATTLVVMGTKDPDFPDPVAEAKVVAARLGGRVELIEGAGHYPHAEMPEVAAPKILDFLAAARAAV